MRNYYGSLCTEMYGILHPQAPVDELAFYLSYAEEDMRILESLCGSGRFLVPFMERGYDICGMDLSSEMLAKLQEKAPGAKVVQADILSFEPEEKFDYIFISSGSISLFTDMGQCREILKKMKDLLKPGGKFVFAVVVMGDGCPDDVDYKIWETVETKEGYQLVLKMKNRYDEKTQTQYSISIYQLYDGEELLQEEEMDFQTHLYRLGELEPVLKEVGFTDMRVYSSYDKQAAKSDDTEILLFECGVYGQQAL